MTQQPLTPSTGSSVAGTLGRYRMLYQFASGGMASVYLAQFSGSDGFRKLVAVKLIHPHLAQDTEFIHMFIDEARLASRITHPNVAQVLELGQHLGRHFMVMEYVHGESLSEVMRATALPIAIGCRVISQAAAGLHAAHELVNDDGANVGVVHRNISPSNIMIGYDGVVKVIDFGVAKAKGSLHVSTGHELKGKFSYMAPEQLGEHSTVSRQTDIFALGIVLFEVTTRRRLFRGDTDVDSLRKVLTMAIPRPGRVLPGYPAELEAIVLRALERDPARRFETAEELHKELEHYLVSTGTVVVPSDLAALMTAAFETRIAEKRARREAAVKPELPTISIKTPTGPRVPEPATEPQIGRPRGSHGRWLAVVGAIGLLLVLATVYLLRDRDAARAGTPRLAPDAGTGARTKQAATPRADIAPTTVEVSIQVDPADARLSLDGKPVTNPCKLELVRRPATIWAEASAPGHKSSRFAVTLAISSQHRIQLERRYRPVRPGHATRRDAQPSAIKLIPPQKPLFEDPYK